MFKKRRVVNTKIFHLRHIESSTQKLNNRNLRALHGLLHVSSTTFLVKINTFDELRSKIASK